MPLKLQLILGHMFTIVFVIAGVVLMESQIGQPQGGMVMLGLVCLGLTCYPMVVLFSHMLILTFGGEKLRESARELLRYLIPIPKPKDEWEDY